MKFIINGKRNENFNFSTKYEVVIGLTTDSSEPNEFNGPFSIENVQYHWQEYAKMYFEKTGTYVSAIAVFGHALYHTDWGCPVSGEQVLTFHCTVNPKFIKDLDIYEEGVLYITKKLKKHFKQHTITVTKLIADVCYLTDEDNEDE